MIIETHDLWKTYGRFDALRGLNLAVPQGSVFALLGANGAGKTTAIKALLNIVEPTRGSARVLGVESRAIGPRVLGQIGYVSESQVFPARLRVDEFFRYVRAFSPIGIEASRTSFSVISGCPPSAESVRFHTACG